MSIFQTNMSGPLALNVEDGTKYGAGAEMTLHESTWSRGDVCQFFNSANASIDGVNTNKLNSLDGTLANAGLVDAGSFQFVGVVTSKDSVPAGYEGSVVTHGKCVASVWFKDDTGVVGINEGDPVYLVIGEKYLSATATITGETIGRIVGVAAQTVAAASLAEGAHPITIILKGDPL